MLADVSQVLALIAMVIFALGNDTDMVIATSALVIMFEIRRLTDELKKGGKNE